MDNESEKINRAEAVHFILKYIDEEKTLLSEDRVIFISADLFEDFIKYLPKSKNFRTKIMSVFKPVNELNIEAGQHAVLNNLEIHIIDGKDKIYGGADLQIEKVLDAVKRFNEKKEVE